MLESLGYLTKPPVILTLDSTCEMTHIGNSDYTAAQLAELLTYLPSRFGPRMSWSSILIGLSNIQGLTPITIMWLAEVLRHQREGRRNVWYISVPHKYHFIALHPRYLPYYILIGGDLNMPVDLNSIIQTPLKDYLSSDISRIIPQQHDIANGILNCKSSINVMVKYCIFDSLPLKTHIIKQLMIRLRRIKSKITHETTWKFILMAMDRHLCRRIVRYQISGLLDVNWGYCNAKIKTNKSEGNISNALIELMSMYPNMIPYMGIVSKCGIPGLLAALPDATVSHLTGVILSRTMTSDQRCADIQQILRDIPTYKDVLIKYNIDRLGGNDGRRLVSVGINNITAMDVMSYVPYDIIHECSGNTVKVGLRNHCSNSDLYNSETRIIANNHNSIAALNDLPQPMTISELLRWYAGKLDGISFVKGTLDEM